MKNLYKFFNKSNIPWVNIIWSSHYRNGGIHFPRKVESFWWRDVLKTMITYKGFSRVVVEDGRSTQLWFDQWDNIILVIAYLEPFSFATNKDITLRRVKDVEYYQDMFHMPMSGIAYEQYQILIQSLQGLHISHQHDKWLYSWGSHLYLAQKAYKHMARSMTVHPSYAWLWKTKCQPKHKVFFRLFLKNRLNMKSLLKRRNMELDSYTCENYIL